MTDPLFSPTALTGLKAIVTGGSKGIGKAIVKQLAQAGAIVYVADRNAAPIGTTKESSQIRGARVDLADLEAIDDLAKAIGPVDILVNNVGVDQHGFFTNTGPDDWQFLLRINLESCFALTKAVLPSMQSNGFGRIVNISSEAGRQGSKGGSVYAASKGGLIAFSKSIARENARYGITSNTICPGPVETPLLKKAIDNHGGDKMEAAMKSATLVGRLGTPDEVAVACVFLASRQASFITGETLGVSGGMGTAS